MIFGCDPEPATPVFRDPEDLVAQRIGNCPRSLDLAGAKKGDTFGRTDPEHACRVFKKTIHTPGGHALTTCVRPPLIFRKSAQAVRSREPHRAIGTFCDCKNRGRDQAIYGCIGCEAAILAVADATVQRSGPYCSIPPPLNRRSAVSRKPCCLCASPVLDRAVFDTERRQSATFSANP